MALIREAVRDINRVRQIALAVARHGFGDTLDRARFRDVLGRKEVATASEGTRRKSSAARFRDLLAELGPTYVKLGQVLSSRPDLLPAAWTDELRTLQDDAPPLPLAEIREVIEAELGHPVEALYASIDDAPLAAASIAQVHRAVTLDGRVVAIKVQRPRIEEKIRADLDILSYAAKLLDATIEESAIYEPIGIVEEFERSIHEELDFLAEARNIQAFGQRAAHRDGIRIPEVITELSSRRVLTLEFLEGTKITSACPPHDGEALAKRLLEHAFRQIFEDGLFHGDPHPGNVLVQEDGTLVLLDFGLVGRLTAQMRENIVLLVLALSLRDADSVARLVYRVGIPDQRTNLGAFKQEIASILGRYVGATLKEIESKTLLRELLDLAVRYRIQVPKEYAILFKAAATIDGIVRSLAPNLDAFAFGTPYAKELLHERLDPSALFGGSGLRSLLRAQTFLQDVPTQLSQILLDLEGGKFTAQARVPEVASLERSVRALGVTVLLGVLSAALVVAGVGALSQVDVMIFGRFPLPAVLGVLALLGAGALFWTAMSWSALQGRIRKISLNRFLKRRRR